MFFANGLLFNFDIKKVAVSIINGRYRSFIKTPNLFIYEF